MLLQEQIVAEINRIPSDKLAEVYDLIHYFRVGLMHEMQEGPDKSADSFSKRWQGRFKLTEPADDTRMGYLKQRYHL
jgi:hypothetical protein